MHRFGHVCVCEMTGPGTRAHTEKRTAFDPLPVGEAQHHAVHQDRIPVDHSKGVDGPINLPLVVTGEDDSLAHRNRHETVGPHDSIEVERPIELHHGGPFGNRVEEQENGDSSSRERTGTFSSPPGLCVARPHTEFLAEGVKEARLMP